MLAQSNTGAAVFALELEREHISNLGPSETCFEMLPNIRLVSGYHAVLDDTLYLYIYIYK